MSNPVPGTEFNEDFVEKMRSRMSVSYYKYGPIAVAYPDKINAIESLMQRLRKYKATGNTEFLVDAANFAMIEFIHPTFPNAYFEATDSDQSPGRVNVEGQRTFEENDSA